MSLLSVSGKALSAFLLIVPLAASIQLPNLMQRSDYLTTFYVAGKMVLDGHGAQLYPGATASLLFGTPFNSYAHQLLVHMTPETTAVYMYSPLIACLFVPFALLPPQASMLAWQLASIAVLGGCSVFVSLASSSKAKALDLFLIGCLCFAVFQTLLIGAIGIGTGLLPLAAGYFLLMRKREFLSGMTFALLLLKLQYFPTALLIAGSLALCRRPACALGMASGIGILVLVTFSCLSPHVFYQWLLSLKLSDTIFSNPAYGYPVYLISSLPALLLHFFPMEMRITAKLPCYLLAAAIGLHSLWFTRAVIRTHMDEPQRVFPYIMLIGIFVLPLVLPHFLFYDLCVMALASMIIYGHEWPNDSLNKELRKIVTGIYLLIACYTILYMSPAFAWAQPTILIGGFVAAYIRLLTLRSRLGTTGQVQQEIKQEIQ